MKNILKVFSVVTVFGISVHQSFASTEYLEAKSQIEKFESQIFSEFDEDETKGFVDAAVHDKKTKSNKLKGIFQAAKAYKKFKKKDGNKQVIKDFKLAAQEFSAALEQHKKETGSFSIPADLEQNFLSKIKASNVSVGMKLSCDANIAVQLFILNVATWSSCDKVAANGDRDSVEVSFFGLGPGLGVEYADHYTYCLLDNDNSKHASYNVGLRANAALGFGGNASFSAGMNGICFHAGFELGFGLGAALGVYEIGK